MRTSVFSFFLCLFSLPSLSGQCGLQSGPMNGYSDMLEVAVWVQTKCAQEARIRYWIENHPDTSWWSDPVSTVKSNGYTAHLIADKVTPGNTYTYELYLGGEKIQLSYPTKFVSQPLWQWRTDAPDFSFAAGSCTYINEPRYDRPGRSYGGGYQIFNSIRNAQTDFMLWLGDNTYLREVDWNSRSGIYHRYTHTRTLREMQPLLASMHHYATWDDHDYGPNDSERSYWLKDVTLQAFKDFWANPNYGAGDTEGITGTFFWNDCQFFVMDDRWYHAPKGAEAEYYGEKQLTWLIEALRSSRASFKFVCTGGQVLNTAQEYENLANYARERQMLLDSIDKYNIKGVVFLTGDRHHSEVSRMVTNDGDVLYDITASPLTSSPSPHPDEANALRIQGSHIVVRNFAVFSVTGPQTMRQCKVTFKDSDGNVLYEHLLQ